MFKPLWLLEPPRPNFDCADLDLMQRAFDDIWPQFSRDFTEGAARQAARQELALSILKVVDFGERNPGIVKAYATAALMLHRDLIPKQQNGRDGH